MRLSDLRYIFCLTLGGCLITACNDKDDLSGVGSDDELVNVSFTVQVPYNTRAETPLPAEQLRSLRVVMVDLGYSKDGEWISPPSVEYNELFTAGRIGSDKTGNGGEQEDIVKIDIPRIHSDRMKKLYLIANAEPDVQPSLDIRLADGSRVPGYGDINLFLPADEDKLPQVQTSPIDKAVFMSPRGSYVSPQNLISNEELLTPMTGCYTFSIPPQQEIAQKYPSLNPKLTYPIPGELLLVRAVNKIWFEFINATYQNDYQPLELLVTEWTLSDVNHGDSYFFGQPGENRNILGSSYQKTEDNINEPWMQWIYAEALRTQQDHGYQWLGDYYMPDGAKKSTLVFRPGNYANGTAGVPRDSEGLFITAPTTMEGSTITTENLPVYFAESHAESPQQYEMTFTVWQRGNSRENWANPFTYSVKSSTNPNDNDPFHLLSLFRNTDVVMQVKFVTGRSGVEMEVELHPYGSVELNPSFGL